MGTDPRPAAAAVTDAVGVGTGAPDLWCTYAAIRTLAWLGRTDRVADRDGVVAYLTSRRNSDGGYAWSAGMSSDAWATFYCTQALADLDHPAPRPDATVNWLHRTWSGAAYGMMPGQTPDAWATHFSTRTVGEICGERVPDLDALTDWLRGLQCADGGLTWSPADADGGAADVRACYYGVMAWRSASTAPPPWDVDRLVRWLRSQQDATGGFRFSATAEIPCAWATYRAVGALTALGARPADPNGCVAWLLRLRGESGAFVRWEGYPVEDVWASFCAIGTLRALGADTDPVRDAVLTRLDELACPGGYTYRDAPSASDALSTAALALHPDTDRDRRTSARRWLESCQLPNEGGVMYMPGRGAEVRCTLWAVAAGAFRDDPAGAARIADWIGELQNPDGGFGYWQGRGSDLVSTASAIETLTLIGADPTSTLDATAVARFVDSCAHPDGGYGNVPGARGALRPGLQAWRVRHALGRAGHPLGRVTTAEVTALLDRHRVRGGGFANDGNRLPDLLSTYDAVLTADRAELAVDRPHLDRFLRVVTGSGGTAWTPLAPGPGGPLADCLGALLRTRSAAAGAHLPALALS